MKIFSSGNITAMTKKGITTTKVHYTIEYADKTLYVLVTLIKHSEQDQTESALDFDF